MGKKGEGKDIKKHAKQASDLYSVKIRIDRFVVYTFPRLIAWPALFINNAVP